MVKKRGILAGLAAAALLCTACRGVTTSEATAATAAMPSDTSTAAAVTGPVTETGNFGSIYAAYYHRIQELAPDYGPMNGWYPPLVETTTGAGYYESCSYLTGLCAADLVDFNGDGVQELFLIYFNGKLTGKNMNGISIPQAGSYEIEIWTYAGGTLTRLLHETQVGDFMSYQPYQSYWDSDNCFATVYENAAGRPVIQLFSDDSTGDKCSYTNMYWADGGVKRDVLQYTAHTMTMNGVAIDENTWNQNVSGYNKILLCTHLSSDSTSSKGLLGSYGIDYGSTISQTNDVCGTLSQGKKPPAWRAAEGAYIPFYLQKIDETNRTLIDDPDSSGWVPNPYGLYDLDQNGVPELIVETGNCEAAYMFDVYTVANSVLVDCGQFSGFHTILTVGDSTGMVGYLAQMDCYEINKITLKGTMLTVQQIASGEVQDPENNTYPALSVFGLGDYSIDLPLCYGTTPFLLYAYGD